MPNMHRRRLYGGISKFLHFGQLALPTTKIRPATRRTISSSQTNFFVVVRSEHKKHILHIKISHTLHFARRRNKHAKSSSLREACGSDVRRKSVTRGHVGWPDASFTWSLNRMVMEKILLSIIGGR